MHRNCNFLKHFAHIFHVLSHYEVNFFINSFYIDVSVFILLYTGYSSEHTFSLQWFNRIFYRLTINYIAHNDINALQPCILLITIYSVKKIQKSSYCHVSDNRYTDYKPARLSCHCLLLLIRWFLTLCCSCLSFHMDVVAQTDPELLCASDKGSTLIQINN